MSPVATEYDLLVDATSVKISWTEPYGSSETVLDYEVIIRTSDLTNYIEDAVNCDG